MVTFRQQEFNLKIQKKQREDGRIQLSVTIPAKATENIIQGASYVLAMQNGIDMQDIKLEDLEQVVLDKVGEAQFNAFSNHYAMEIMTPFAISEKNIEPIMEPELSTNEKITPNKEFNFTAVVTPKPRYKLSSYDPVTIRIPEVTITEEEIDAQLVNIAERNAKVEVDEGATADLGKEVVFGITTNYKESGEPFKILTAERRVYQLGENYLPPEFDKHITGMKAGDSRTFDLELPTPPKEDGTPGEPDVVEMTVNLTQVNKKVVPAITDAWVKENVPEAKDVAGLRQMLRKEGTEYKTREQESMKLFFAASELAKRFEGVIADELYEYTRGDMLAHLTEQLKQQGMTLDQYIQSMGMEQQQFSMSLMIQVRETLRQSFALDALASHLKLSLTEDDINDTVSRMAPGNEARARGDIEGAGRGYIITEAALRTKANKWLVETATIEVE